MVEKKIFLKNYSCWRINTVKWCVGIQGAIDTTVSERDFFRERMHYNLVPDSLVPDLLCKITRGFVVWMFRVKLTGGFAVNFHYFF